MEMATSIHFETDDIPIEYLYKLAIRHRMPICGPIGTAAKGMHGNFIVIIDGIIHFEKISEFHTAFLSLCGSPKSCQERGLTFYLVCAMLMLLLREMLG
jgi:hypothetical protein